MKSFDEMTGFKEIPAVQEEGRWDIPKLWGFLLYLVDSLLSLIVGRVIPLLIYMSFIFFTVHTLMSAELDELLVNVAVTTVFFVFILLFVFDRR